MRGRLLVNVLLLACAAVLGIWIYRDAGEPATNRLTALDPAAVERIAVQRSGERIMAFVRTDGGWRIAAPRELPASRHHLDLLLGFLELPVAARYPSDEVDLDAAGLARPMLTLIVDGRRYAFGSLDPMERRRYLLHDGEVLLVREGVSALLTSPWWNFIDRRLLPDGEPASLRFANGRQFMLDPPQQVQWQQGSADIVEPLPAGVAGEPFALELRTGEPIHWQWLGGEQPRLLRPDLGLQYRLSSELLHALLGGGAEG